MATDYVVDWTTFTQVDTGDRIATNTTSIWWTNLATVDENYAYRDYGADNFSGSWVVDGSFNINSTSYSTSKCAMVAFSDTLGNAHEIFGEDDGIQSTAIVAYAHSSYIDVYIEYYPDSGEYYSIATSADLYFDTNYYFEWYNSEVMGKMGVRFFTDIEKKNLLEDIYFTCTHNGSYRYVYGASSYLGYQEHHNTGILSNVTIYNSVDLPTVTTIDSASTVYNGVFEDYTTTVTGNLTDDGGEGCATGFYYTINGTEDWHWSSGGYNETGIFDGFITTDNTGATYEYYAYASNTYGTANGTTYYFTTDIEPGEPQVETLAYPYQQSNVGDIWYNAYGQVLYDGAENCTGSIQWRTIGGEWQDTSNTTGLRMTDLFSANITGLSLLTDYQFRAVATNTYGTVYGNVGSIFIYPPQITPTVVTLPVSDLASDTVRLNVLLVDDGGAPCFVRAYYRQYDATTWTLTNIYYEVTDNETRSWLIEGLTPNEQYVYKAYAYNYEEEAYGDIVMFQMYFAISLPVIETVGVYDINDTTIQATGEIIHDGGSECEVWFEYREQGGGDWILTDSEYGLVTGYEFSVYLFNMYDGYFQIRFCAENEQGVSYGNIIDFQFDSGAIVIPDDDDISDLLILITQIRQNLGMTGTFGTWAFMGMILLLVSLLFGIAMVAVKESTGRAAIGVTWLLATIAVVGAFLFTGQLGMWPFFILVGGVVALMIIVASVKLSGGGTNG